jgi:hypothetical protein
MTRRSRRFALACTVTAWCGLLVDIGSAARAGDGPTITNSALSADELAYFLGVEAWVFEYEGGSPHCWLEVSEEGQKTVEKKVLLEVNARSGGRGEKGRIILFIKRGEIKLRDHAESSESGASVGLNAKSLWWGWESWGGSMKRLPKTTLAAGAEVNLLELTRTSFEPGAPKNAPASKKVTLVLKAQFPK